MSEKLECFNQAINKLEELVVKKLASGEAGLIEENLQLQKELDTTKKEHMELVKTSEEVINELNNSIQVIDNFFKKQDASNKNL